MKIGCNTVAFRKYPLELALDKIARAGYEYVEVEANLTWCPHVDPWKDDPIAFKDKVASYGFKGVSAIGSHREIATQEEAVRDLEQSLAWCHAAGVPVVLTGEGRVPTDTPIDDALAVIRTRLERLAKAAAQNEVFLALEDHGSISLGALDGLPRIMSLVDSSWIRVNFDTANIHRGDYVGTDRSGFEWKLGAAHSFSEVALAKLVGPQIQHVHFKDVVGRNAVILGTGEIDLMGCLREFKQAGFDGVLSYETEGWEDADQAEVMIVKSLEWTRRALAELERVPA